MCCVSSVLVCARRLKIASGRVNFIGLGRLVVWSLKSRKYCLRVCCISRRCSFVSRTEDRVLVCQDYKEQIGLRREPSCCSPLHRSVEGPDHSCGKHGVVTRETFECVAHGEGGGCTYGS